MKKILLSLLFLIIFITVYFTFYTNKGNESANVLPVTTKKSVPEFKRLPHGNIIDITYRYQNLKILAVRIPAVSEIILIPNFAQKEFGENIVNNYNCDAAINGGFYKENGDPLGLFINEGTKIGDIVKSRVANGFFWQVNNSRFIDWISPQKLDGVDFILQSGPLMMVNNRKVSIVSDEKARRSAIGMDYNNNVYIISVFSADNIFQGPYLSDLSLIFSQEKVREELNLEKILNLDGGGASFFFSKDNQDRVVISPISPIGSVICIRNMI